MEQDVPFWMVACAGSCLANNYKPKPHDKANIMRCKRVTTEIQLKGEKVKTKVIDHDDSLFSKKCGKLQTGLSCYHKFNSNLIHFSTNGIQKNIDDLFENLGKAMDKYNATCSIGTKTKSSVSRKKKENKKKSAKRKAVASELRKRRGSLSLYPWYAWDRGQIPNMAVTGSNR